MPKERIVIVDDDPDLRAALTLILEPAGYAVTCCSTGPEAVDVIHKDPPDLILLDVMLASPSEGFHLAYEFRSDDVVKNIPIIMISAIGRQMGIDYARELGSNYLPVERFLDKPLDASTVLGAVAEILGSTPRPVAHG